MIRQPQFVFYDYLSLELFELNHNREIWAAP